MMLTVATLLWDSNPNSEFYSQMYDESWVDKLYRGFDRNLTSPFRFVCYTDRKRKFSEPVLQRQIAAKVPDYGSCIQPYEMGDPMILVGLDTIVVGNIDHLADYCFRSDTLAVPRDPSNPHTVCNGVALVPAGYQRLWTDYPGCNDMEWIRAQKPAVIDDIWPGEVVSYRGHARAEGLDGVNIVYFHGREKPHELAHVDWVKEHWR